MLTSEYNMYSLACRKDGIVFLLLIVYRVIGVNTLLKTSNPVLKIVNSDREMIIKKETLINRGEIQRCNNNTNNSNSSSREEFQEK